MTSYDDRGLLVSTTGGSSPSSSTYDAAGRPVTEGDITLRPGGDTFDPAAWDDWMDCVRDVANPSQVADDE